VIKEDPKELNESEIKHISATVPEVIQEGKVLENNPKEEMDNSFVTPKKVNPRSDWTEMNTADTLTHLKNSLRNGGNRFGFSSSKEGDIFSHNPTRFTPKRSDLYKMRKYNYQTPSSSNNVRGHNLSLTSLPKYAGNYANSYNLKNPTRDKYSNFSQRKYLPSMESKQSLDVSLYKYLDDHRENNPSNPLNFSEGYNRGKNDNYSNRNYGAGQRSYIKGIGQDFKNELKDKGRLVSPMEYTFKSYGKIGRNIAAPEQYKMVDRG